MGALAPESVSAEQESTAFLSSFERAFEANKEWRPYIYGQIDKGFLIHDDGNDTNVFPLVDNDNSGTRIGLTIEGPVFALEESAFLYGNVEWQWNPYASDSVNQNNKNDVEWGDNNLRHAEVRLSVDGLGRLWAGQGSMASDGSAEHDLSGTSVVAYSSITDSAGGQFFAFDGAPGLSGVTIGSAFSNLDGLGRKFRVRYDTPRWRGAGLSTSVGYDAINGEESSRVEWDVAASFSRDEDDEVFTYAAGAAFSRNADNNNRFSGSFSVLHDSSSVSLTLAAGYEDRSAGSRSPTYGYVKLGYAPDLTSLGPTAFAVDLYVGEDFSTDGSDSLSVGIAAVQTITTAEIGSFDIYTLLRHHQYDDPAGSYEDGLSSLTGIRWKF